MKTYSNSCFVACFLMACSTSSVGAGGSKLELAMRNRSPAPGGPDECVNAVEVFDGTNVGTNVGFGPDDAEASCQPNSNHDAWFKYTAPCGGDVQITTNGSVFVPSNDTVLSVFDACGGIEIACDDDGSVGLLSALTFNATANNVFFIRVAGVGDNVGDIVLNIRRLDTCFIEGVCVPDGMVNPGNECQACMALASNTDWSSRFKGTLCNDPSFGECDSPDACDGAGNCEANHKPDGIACTADVNECTDDICLAGVCAHPNRPLDSPCGDPLDTECDNPDSCDGAGLCRDNLEPPGFACGDPVDTDCDNPDTCDGAGLCLDNLEPDNLACTDDGNDCTFDFYETGSCIHPNKPLGAACGNPADTQCDNPDTCDGSGLCQANLEPDLTPCDDSNICTGPDLCMAGACDAPFIPEAPVVETGGARVLTVTPQAGGSTIPQALRVTSPDHPCLVKYIGATGELGDLPVFQSPLVWSTVTAFGSELVPESTYDVAAECGGDLSGVGTATTAPWGDLNFDGMVDLFDLFCILNGFAADFSNCTFRNVDLFPCTPDGMIDIFDLFQVLNAFSGEPFPCAGPCDGGACCDGTTCIILTASECQAAGGTFQGDGIDCFPNPCSPGPDAPETAAEGGGAILTVVPVRAGGREGTLHIVDLYVSGFADLQAYQVSLGVVGSRRGRLSLERMFVNTAREDYVFFAGSQSFQAVDEPNLRMANAVLDGGVTRSGKAYLGSYAFRASGDAEGVFRIIFGEGVYLLDSSGRKIEVQLVGTMISVRPDTVHEGKAIRSRR